MAPVNKIKTYSRPNRSLVNNSLDVKSIVFGKHKKRQKKRKFVIKELPARTVGETLLGEDSFQISTEDTFDKLAKGNVYNPVNIKSHISIVNSDSDASKSIKKVNSFYSPIITRRKKHCAVLKEVSSNLDVMNENNNSAKSYLYSPVVTRSKKRFGRIINISDNSNNAEVKNKSDSVMPHFKEPTVDNIDLSLEVEKVRNHVPNSLSYIIVPEVKEGEISIGGPRNASEIRGDLSYDPIFTKTFREKQLVHSSTPLAPLKSKKMVNYTLSPINNVSQSENIERGNQTSNFTMSKCFSSLKSLNDTSTEQVPKEVCKFLTNPKITVDACSQSEINYPGFPNAEKYESEVAMQQFQKIIKDKTLDITNEPALPETSSDNTSRVSFITLRKRRILKTSFQPNKSRNKSNRNNSGDASQNRTESKQKSVVSSQSMQSLSEIESFAMQHKEPSSLNNFGDCDIEGSDISRSFINKKRRRLTDSYLTSKKQKTMDNDSNKEEQARRFSYTKQSVDYPEVLLRDVVVHLPKIKLAPRDNSTSNLSQNESSTSSNESYRASLTNFLDTDTSTNGSSEVSDNDFFRLKNPIFKDLAVDLTRLELQPSGICGTESSAMSLPDKSKSLFCDYSVTFSNVNPADCSSIACQTLEADKSCVSGEEKKVLTKQEEITNSPSGFSDSKISSEEKSGISIFKSKKTTGLLPKISDTVVLSNVSKNNADNRDDSSNDVKEYSVNAEEFENFYEDVTKCFNNKQTASECTEMTRSSDAQLSYVATSSFDKNGVGKDLIVNLTKSPWRRNDNQTASSSKNSTKDSVIDLTDSFEDGNVRSSQAVNDISAMKEERQSLSDIVESSILGSSHVDDDGFKKPVVSNTRRRPSKTLVLKAGKLWRRSLAIYRRSSLMLTVWNQDVCRLVNGSFCACPKCSLARQNSRLSNRRNSIRIVPAQATTDIHREISNLENYAHNASYVSDRILDDSLEADLRSLSLSKGKNSIVQNSTPVTARELVLKRCGQEEPLPFEECYSKSLLQNCQKIGEGVYGEVFLFRNPNGGTSVMKVIPIEGDLIVNGERQKKFEEILSEVTIALELSNLRNKKFNKTSGFSEVQKVCCVLGRYPEKLIDLWDLYDETRGSENDSPEIFGEEQLYVVLQLANGGSDLEAFIFNNSLQAYTMFQQVACALAVAEEELQFEHRDLHWGNVLLSAVDKNSKVTFRLDDKNFDIMTKGVEVAIIDFTLSRIECEGVVIFNDLGLDPDLFTAEGDYQFEVYKLMQKKNGNNWQRFEPYTNILWLHYTLDKAFTALRYKNTQTKVHKEYLVKLRQFKEEILNYNSAKEFVLQNF